ncbi:MAG TPA: hypothetical protein VGL27_19075 [Negativicutes bacterium]
MSVKINCIDTNDTESAFAVCKYACAELAQRGVDAIEISGGSGVNTVETSAGYIESIYQDYAAEIASAVDVPIILVNKNRTPKVMTEILNTTGIEYFSLSRPLLCQPDLVNIWEKNGEQKPKCISCGKCFGEDDNMCIFNR